MIYPQNTKEVADLNLSYLLLAQRLLRQDRGAGMLRLGMDPSTADLVLGLRPPQILSLSTAGPLVCGLRCGAGLRAVLERGAEHAVQQAHLSIVLTAAGSRFQHATGVAA